MLKESISGLRGLVGDGLDPEVITAYCAAFSKILPAGPIVIARDSRPSGGPIAQLVCATLKLLGRDTIYVGIQTTPTAEVITERTDAAGGIIITASHNPPEWNALKFVGKDGIFFDTDEFEKLKAVSLEKPNWVAYNAIGGGESLDDAARMHIDAIIWLPWLEAHAIRDARFKVVVDANGGTGSIVLLPLLEKLGCEVISIGCEPDGVFIHPPEPIPENLKSLEQKVKENGADIGFATDPDADRLALVDETGKAIGEEYTLAIGAAEVLEYNPGPVVVNLSTSAMVESLGQPVFRTPVGEINVARKMLEIDSPVGGEGNGGLIIPACHPGRDGPLAAAVILHRMARTGKKLSELTAEFPKLYMIKTKISHTGFGQVTDPPIREKIENVFAPIDINTTDGIRITVTGGWLHIRESNTEPILRIIAEADSEALARGLVDKARRLLE